MVKENHVLGRNGSVNLVVGENVETLILKQSSKDFSFSFQVLLDFFFHFQLRSFRIFFPLFSF